MEVAVSQLRFGAECTVLWGCVTLLHTKLSLIAGDGGEVRKNEPTI